jgi:hypothetical protein
VYTEVSHEKMKAKVRIGLNTAHILLGFLLLSNIDFQNTVSTVGIKQSIIAGLGPFNASIEVPGSPFLLYSDLNALLQSEQNAIPVPSPNATSCDECFSYLLPGELNDIGLLPDGDPPAAESPEGVTLFISKAAPAYQFDYYPLSDIEFPSSACKAYGELIKLCLMNINEDLVAGILNRKLDLTIGWTACPFDNTTWQCNTPENEWINNKLTTILRLRMSSLFADTVFNLKNGAIQSSNYVSSLSPTFYSARHIFTALNPALSNLFIQQSISTTINDNSLSGIEGDVEPAALRNLLASALYEYNWGNDWNQTSDAVSNMYVHGYYATEKFRLVIADYSLALYTILTVGELIWCLLILGFICFGKSLIPTMSGFPEWDFASKCVRVSPRQIGTGMDSLMRDLSSGSTKDVMKRIKSEQMTVRTIYGSEAAGVQGQVWIVSRGRIAH